MKQGTNISNMLNATLREHERIDQGRSNRPRAMMLGVWHMNYFVYIPGRIFAKTLQTLLVGNRDRNV